MSDISEQTFLGKIYRLYPRQKYFSASHKFMHRVVWEYFNGEIPKGFHIHHKNGNRGDNRLENLELIEGKHHNSVHSKKWFDQHPDFVKRFWQKGVPLNKAWHTTNEGRQWHSEHIKRQWQRWGYKDHICQQCGKTYQTRYRYITKFCHPNCKAKALRARRKAERQFNVL